MPRPIKPLIKISTQLFTYHAEKTLGKGALSTIVSGVADLVGESATKKIESFLDQGEQAEKLLLAFRNADECFINIIGNDTLKQAVISKPFSGLPKLEKIAKDLPSNLDDSSLLKVLEAQFRVDWGKQIPEHNIQEAAKVYRVCLDRALATQFDQLLPTLFRITERIQNNTQELLQGQKQILSKLDGIPSETKVSDSEKNLLKRTYLVHTISELKEWKLRYAPMFARFDKLTILGKIRSKEDEPEPLLDLLRKNKNIVILGPAGAGKTTTLQKEALEIAQRAFKNDDLEIPIVIFLRDYGQQGIERLVEAAIRPWGLSLALMEKELSAGKIVFFFDGLNEVPLSIRDNCYSNLRKFIREHLNNRFIFTSRTLEYQDSWLSSGDRNFSVCEIQSLTQTQIVDYIKRYFVDQGIKAERLIKELNLNDYQEWENRKSLARLAGIPLLLQMLILVYEDKNRIPRNEGELVLGFIDEMLSRREPGKVAGKFDVEIKKKLLASIAWKMSEHDQASLIVSKRYAYENFLSRLSELKQSGEAPQSYEANEIWQELQNNHLIIERDDAVYWPHPLYKELFVGLSLRDSCFDSSWRPRFTEITIRFRKLEVKRSNDPRFESGITMLEVIPEQYRLDAIANVACINPSIAKETYIRLEPEFNQGLSDEFLSRLTKLAQQKSDLFADDYYRNLVITIGYIHDSPICSQLIQISETCPCWEGRDQAVIELWVRCYIETSCPGILEHLMGISKLDESQLVKRTALSKLISLVDRENSEDVISFLVERFIEEPLGFVNDTQINFPKVLYTQVALDEFKDIASNPNESTENRCRAILGIGKSGTQLDDLLQFVIGIATREKQEEIRKTAVKQLKHFPNEKTVTAFRNIIRKDAISEIRQCAVNGLDALSGFSTTDALLIAIEDTSDDVGNATIEALFNVHQKRNVTNKIIKLTKSPMTLVAKRSLILLAKIASTTSKISRLAAKELSFHANEADKNVRLQVARALREYDPALCNKIIRDLLVDSDSEIRLLAQQTYEELGIE